jgi:hypothetical protein
MTELARPLETGWHPDTPVGDSLLRRFTANQADLQDHLVAAVGGRSDRTPGVALSDSGVASAYLNQAVMLRPVSDASDPVLDHVAAFYRGSVGLLLSPWPTPDLASRGWQLVGHPMFVVRSPVGEPVAAPPGNVVVRRAESAGDLALVERILINGYPAPGLDGLPANRAMGPALLGSAVRHWIGYLDGRPVAVAASHAAHGVANLGLAATLPAARRHGAWRALVAARCADTPDLPAVAFTSDYSRPGFVRMGFLPITRFTLWAVTAAAPGELPAPGE